MKKIVVSALVAVVLAASVWGAGAPEPEYGTDIIATTSWTAAFAEAAGAGPVRMLAPYEMQHPSEYELKPSDIVAVSKAKVIIFAGYEVMVSRLKEAAAAESAELIQITTTYSLADIEKSLGVLAGKIGSQEAARANIAEIRGLYAELKTRITDGGLAGAPVIVHFFQRPLAQELGFTIAGVFGPAPLEASQIANLAKTGAGIIIDNEHNPIGRPLEEVMPDARYVRLINFPGASGTRTLTDVIRRNSELFEEVMTR